MGQFRLLMARQLGEQKAKEHGFDALPVDPLKVAADKDIMVEPKAPDRKGVSGGIIFSGENVGIFYATNIKNEGYQRFTIAHELGHYFLPGHPEEIQKIAPVHMSRAGFTQGDSSIEIEADHFASGFLMPSHLVKQLLRLHPPGFSAIESLASEAKCSITAAAIRTAECTETPMAIIVSQGNSICYGFLSNAFKNLDVVSFPRKGSQLPRSATLSFNQKEDNVLSGHYLCAETTLADWFGGSSGVALDEEIIGLGEYGFTLTVLSSEELPDDPDDDDEDDEEALIESYTPKFAYNR